MIDGKKTNEIDTSKKVRSLDTSSMIINTEVNPAELVSRKIRLWRILWKDLKVILKFIAVFAIIYFSVGYHWVFVISTLSLFAHFFLRDKKFNAQLKDYNKRLNLLNRDIKTLHLNQKMLQSSIKDLYKDLKIYGEIKRARINTISETEKE